MENSKVIDLLKSLTVYEQKRFDKYLRSPFFNSNKHIVGLYNYITACLNKTSETELDKKQVFKKIFGNASYKEQQVSDLMTYLMRHLEDFLSYINFENKEFLKKSFLLNELSNRNKNKHFVSNVNEYQKKLNNSTAKEQDYYYANYLLKNVQDHFFIKQGVRKEDKSLQHKSDSFDTFFLIEKLKNLCEMISRKNIISVGFLIHMKNEVVNYIQSNKLLFKEVPVLPVYYNTLLMLEEGQNKIHFQNLKKSLKNNVKYFSEDGARQIYGYAQNYCIQQINAGGAGFHAELFEIYKSLLESKLIFEDGFLSQSDYKNIVSVGLRLEKFEWTKKFIEQYKNTVALEFRENAYEYNLASYYYSSRDYKSALQLLQKVEFTDVFYHLGAKSMLLKMYYELEDVEPFYSLIDAFKVYLGRNKNISSAQRLSHQNLVKWAKRLFDFRLRGGTKNKGNKIIIDGMKSKINLEKQIANLQWLKEKAEEF